MSEWIATLSQALLDSSLRMLFVAAGVALILTILRIRSAAARHAAWTMLLASMLLMPILPHLAPAVSLPVVTQNVAIPQIAPRVPSTESFTAAAPVRQFEMSVGTDTAVSGSARQSAPPNRLQRLLTAASLLYAAGVLYFIVHLGFGWRNMRRLIASSRPIDLLTGAHVYESELVTTPVTVGILRPRIVLPPSWTSWAEEKLRAVLTHENAHIRRRDTLVNFLSHLNCAAFWFHPLSWWLARTLATTSEYACDDAAVTLMATPREYAEVLLNMADAVRRAGRRISWESIGVVGNGGLSSRIDRILTGHTSNGASLPRRVALFLSCSVVIFFVAACRDESYPIATFGDIQAEERRAMERLDAQRAQQKNFGVRAQVQRRLTDDVTKMTAEQAAALESKLVNNPEALEVREQVVYFYGRQLGLNGPQPEKTRALRRKHILWFIEHHPDHDGLGESAFRLSPSEQKIIGDVEGYSQARELWLSKIARKDAPLPVLVNAASFFEIPDKALAEQLLLRAQALDPRRDWHLLFGRLYGLALLGVTEGISTPSFDERLGSNVSIFATNEDDAQSAFSRSVRAKLDASKDAALLYRVARQLMFKRPEGGAMALPYLERVVELDPSNVSAHIDLAKMRIRQPSAETDALLMATDKDKKPEVIAALPPAERFVVLRKMAQYSYNEANSLEVLDRDSAKAARERARKYAEDLLQLAPSFRKDPQYSGALFSASILSGIIAARDGDSANSVKYLRDSTRIPGSEEMAYAPPLDVFYGPLFQLCTILAGSGYRQDVIAFLEHFAAMNVSMRDNILALSARFRAGEAPRLPW